jgi:hypothetical protein
MSEDLTKQDLKASEERIVKLIGDIAARSDERFAAMDERFADVMAKSDERFVAMEQRFAASDERFAAMEQRFAASDERFAAMEQRFAASDERFVAMERNLRRVFALGVREARRERRLRRELDENITRLSAAQLVTEEKFQGLLDALRRGENGHK